MKPHENTCPKAERCKRADTCAEHDIFHSEYLCFEGRVYGNQAHPERGKENVKSTARNKNPRIATKIPHFANKGG